MRGELSVNLILLWEFYPTAGESGTWPFASNHCITGTQTNGRRENRVIPLHNNHRGPIKSITAFTANISSHRPSNLLSYNPRKPILLRESREMVGAESEISHEGRDILWKLLILECIQWIFSQRRVNLGTILCALTGTNVLQAWKWQPFGWWFSEQWVWLRTKILLVYKIANIGFTLEPATNLFLFKHTVYVFWQ